MMARDGYSKFLWTLVILPYYYIYVENNCGYVYKKVRECDPVTGWHSQVFIIFLVLGSNSW